MVKIDRIKKDMAELLAIDKGIESIEVRADTLDEALADAAVQFDTKVSNLEYEVVERGFSGVIGFAKKPWAIRVYQNPTTVIQSKKSKVSVVAEGAASEDEAENNIVNGIYYIHRFGSDIVLKVVLPKNGGTDVNPNDIVSDLNFRADTVKFDKSKIEKFAKTGTDDAYEIIGSYNHVPANDAVFVVDIAKDRKSVFVTVTPPEVGGADLMEDQIRKAVEGQGIMAGISDEKINNLVDSPIYNAPVVVAEEIPPINGKDAYIVYDFETDKSKLRATENDNGQIDFKETNRIQNRVKGDKLAWKVPAEKGKAGKTLFAEYLEATDGKDIPLPIGKCTRVGDDGMSIIADANGQVLLVNDKVTIEPVMELAAVNLKNGGNIDFNGKVIVKGNIEDGFSVKAAGNIEVSGNVGACHLKSDGNIIVSQGIIGRDEAKIECVGSLWAKFIESSEIHVDENLIVQESIMSSVVEAQKKIVLTGKKAQIAGGRLSATEMISAKTIGVAGKPTELTVGVDPKLKRHLEELQAAQNENMKRMDEIDANIVALENQKKMRKALPKEKEESLKAFVEEKKVVTEQSYEYNEEITQIINRIKQLRSVGRVYASGTVYSGVTIYIRDEKEEVHSEVKNVMYELDLETRLVKRSKFVQPDLSDLKGPDGYSSD
ncbi:MAG: FapA family protein [Treponema sp.]|nr:FapA family protein [Treponema sp.]